MMNCPKHLTQFQFCIEPVREAVVIFYEPAAAQDGPFHSSEIFLKTHFVAKKSHFQSFDFSTKRNWKMQKDFFGGGLSWRLLSLATPLS